MCPKTRQRACVIIKCWIDCCYSVSYYFLIYGWNGSGHELTAWATKLWGWFLKVMTYDIWQQFLYSLTTLLRCDKPLALTNVHRWNLMIFVQALPKYLFREMSKPPRVQNKLKNVPSVKFRSENSYHGWERHAESKSCHDCKTWGWTLNTEEKGTRNQNLDTIAKTGSKFKEKLQQSISVSAN